MQEQRISAADRTQAMVQARLHSTTGENEAMVVDASEWGLRLAMEAPPPRGAIVDVLIGAQALGGRVIWRSGARCGIALDKPISVVALLKGGEVPITISPEAIVAYEQRHPLAVALASDGPLATRILQAAMIVMVLLGGIAVVSQIASLGAEPIETARIAMASTNDLAH